MPLTCIASVSLPPGSDIIGILHAQCTRYVSLPGGRGTEYVTNQLQLSNSHSREGARENYWVDANGNEAPSWATPSFDSTGCPCRLAGSEYA